MSERLPIVVVGAGAAGILAGVFAADAAGGRPVLLLERTRDGGRKILISGGGRCNVLPSEVSEARYTTRSSPHTLRNILRSWPLDEQRRFFEQRVGIRLVREAETGKLFPESNRARDVRDRLLRLATDSGADLVFDTHVTQIAPPSGEHSWRVYTAGGREITAAAVVLATGGLSVPATGSDGTGLRIAQQLGHSLHPTYPALTPLTADPAPHADLAGVSAEVHIDAPAGRESRSATGGFLFTHRGYSGPAVLDVSHLAVLSRMGTDARQPLFVRWTSLDAAEWERQLQAASGTAVSTLVRRALPTRLADRLIAEADVNGARPLAQLRRDERQRLIERLTRYPLPWTGDEGYKKAEVTGGGIPLGEIDPRSLQSRRSPGLFLCGEMLDAFGPIGGYNFFWAWATGRAAGRAAAAYASAGITHADERAP